jgi:hypothetical protein
MKAEHRHQLQTNALADRMGKLLQDVKSNPQATSRLLWILGGVVVVLLIAWYFFGAPDSTSGLWVNLDGNTDAESLRTIAREGQGSMASRAALFQRARVLLNQGINDLYTGVDRAKAADSIEQARRIYSDLAPLCTQEPILEGEALAGSAQAEEALLAVPKEGQSKEMRGDLQRAIQAYQTVAQKFPKTFLGEMAAKQAKDLEAGGSKVVAFYTDMGNRPAGIKK